jgi:hypothetical protein
MESSLPELTGFDPLPESTWTSNRAGLEVYSNPEADIRFQLPTVSGQPYEALKSVSGNARIYRRIENGTMIGPVNRASAWIRYSRNLKSMKPWDTGNTPTLWRKRVRMKGSNGILAGLPNGS